MSFRLWTIFYVFALVASALATFGGIGIVCAAIVLGFWLIMFSGSKPAMTLLKCLIAIFLVLGVIALLLPAVSSGREVSRRAQCMSQMKQIVLGLQLHHDSKGSLPPNYVVDASEEPLLSWRVFILPFIEETVLFDRFDRTKAWDDPRNTNVSSIPLGFFSCPSHSSMAPFTNYFAILGPNTAWPGPQGRTFKEFTDGIRNTIVLIEAHRRNANWAEPVDLNFEEAVGLLSRPVSQKDGHRVDNGFFYKPSFGRSIAFADGHVSFLQTPLERKLAAALLTVDGGEDIDEGAINRATKPQLDYAKCYGFALFVGLSLLPTVRVFKRRNEEAAMQIEAIARA